LEEREVLMALAIGKQRAQARAVELQHCRTCGDNAQRYFKAAEVLGKLINTMMEDAT
jgi:hypothetical protein